MLPLSVNHKIISLYTHNKLRYIKYQVVDWRSLILPWYERKCKHGQIFRTLYRKDKMIYFEAAKALVQREEMEITIKHNLNEKDSSSTIMLTISNSKCAI